MGPLTHGTDATVDAGPPESGLGDGAVAGTLFGDSDCELLLPTSGDAEPWGCFMAGVRSTWACELDEAFGQNMRENLS